MFAFFRQITKLTYRSGADGSVEFALETNISCPDKDQEKDVSLGQHKMQQESPSDEDKEQASLNACKTCIVEMELKSRYIKFHANHTCMYIVLVTPIKIMAVLIMSTRRSTESETKHYKH